jgi:hypothetical protein
MQTTHNIQLVDEAVLRSQETTLLRRIEENSFDLPARRQLITLRGELSRRARERKQALSPGAVLWWRLKPDTVWGPLDDEMIANLIPE